MSRHTSVVVAEPYDACTEADTGKLAAKVQDIVNGATVVAMTAIKWGRKMAVLIVWDDA